MSIPAALKRFIRLERADTLERAQEAYARGAKVEAADAVRRLEAENAAGEV